MQLSQVEAESLARAESLLRTLGDKLSEVEAESLARTLGDELRDQGVQWMPLEEVLSLLGSPPLHHAIQTAEAPLTKLLWVQLALQNLSTTDTVAIETQAAAAVGVQAVVLSFEGTPAPACFGTGTLVLCEDGQRRAVQDLRSPVRVVAACPCGGPDAVVEVEC